MDKLILTASDLKGIVENVYGGNSDVPAISVVDENGNSVNKSIKDFLNIEFYSWKNRLVHINAGEFKKADDWVTSLNFYMNKGYALVELTDKELTASQNVDAGTIYGRITFLIQAHKADALDYLTAWLSSKYAGRPQTIQDALGNNFNVYMLFGQLLYDEEPDLEQFGEVIQCSCNFSISYMNNVETYHDDMYQISFDGEKYYEIPFSEGTQQVIYSGDLLPMQKRVDIGGRLNTVSSNVVSFSYFDFANELTKKINDIYYENGAYSIDGVVKLVASDVNPVVWLKAKDYSNVKDGIVPEYVYKMTIDTITKNVTNGTYLATTLVLRPYGKRTV